MEKRNLFVSGKAVVAAVCGAFTVNMAAHLDGSRAFIRLLRDDSLLQRRRGQQGRVVERCRPGRHLA